MYQLILSRMARLLGARYRIGDDVGGSVVIGIRPDRPHTRTLRCPCGVVFDRSIRVIERNLDRGDAVVCAKCSERETDELRELDRETCVHYSKCLKVAAKADAGHVCEDSCKRFKEAPRQQVKLVGSIAEMIDTLDNLLGDEEP